MKKRMNLKRIMAVLLTLLMIVGTMTIGVADVSAVTSSDGEWMYGYQSAFNYYCLTKYLGTKTKVTLPEEIDGHKITAVDLSYSEDQIGTLKHITIPKTYTYMDFSDSGIVSVTCSREYTEPTMTLDQFGSFYNCKKLKKVILPNLIADTCLHPLSGQVGRLKSGTFQNCTKLEEVTLPDNILQISDECFKNCKSLKSLTIPEGCKRIEEYALQGCTSMSTLTLPGTIEYLTPIQMSSTRTIICPVGSYAYNYIKAKEIEHKEAGLNISYDFINSEPVDLCGDANGDGEFTIKDASLIQMHLVDLLTYDICNGDTDGNGKVNICDVTHLQRIIAKIIS